MDWLPFATGLAAGCALAFFIYAGLKPRLEKAVLAQQELKDKAAAAKDTATAKTPTKAPATTTKASAPEATGPGQANATPATATTTAAPATGATNAIRLTRLAPSGGPATVTSRRPWPAMLLLMAGALAAGGAAWQQYRRQPQPPGAITSPVLEALFTLGAHRDILQKTLGLSPRQIKRFSSKARVQHSQLRAQARAGSPQLGIPFPVDFQIRAFQVLLLLEENRKLPPRFPQNDAAAFISEVQAAYSGHPELTTALLQAYAHPIISEAKAREGSLLTPDPTAEERFLRQLFELNAGLLA